MQFMTALLGGSSNTFLNAAFALGIVLVSIVLGLWGLKLLTKAGRNVGRGKQRRLEIVDSAVIDSKRQVIIIRRDNVEHLIMTGGPADLVIESGIAVPEPVATAPRRPAQRPAAPPPAPTPDIAMPTAPEPHSVPREMVDRLRDLTRPAPLRPHPPAPPSTSLRHTGLLRPVSRQDSDIIPMGPSLRVDNSAGPPSDSAKPAIDATGGRTGLGGRNRFFRSISRGDAS